VTSIPYCGVWWQPSQCDASETRQNGSRVPKHSPVAPAFILTLRNLDQDLRTLVDVRNGVIHAGSLDDSKIQGALVPYLKASELLLRDVGETPDDYWAGEAGIVSSRLAKAVEDAKQRVSPKMRAAKDAYLHRTREHEGEALEAFLAPCDVAEHVEHRVHQPRCPSCSASLSTW
jgi:hypothetical protein